MTSAAVLRPIVVFILLAQWGQAADAPHYKVKAKIRNLPAVRAKFHRAAQRVVSYVVPYKSQRVYFTPVGRAEGTRPEVCFPIFREGRWRCDDAEADSTSGQTLKACIFHNAKRNPLGGEVVVVSGLAAEALTACIVEIHQAANVDVECDSGHCVFGQRELEEAHQLKLGKSSAVSGPFSDVIVPLMIQPATPGEYRSFDLTFSIEPEKVAQFVIELRGGNDWELVAKAIEGISRRRTPVIAVRLKPFPSGFKALFTFVREGKTMPPGTVAVVAPQHGILAKSNRRFLQSHCVFSANGPQDQSVRVELASTWAMVRGVKAQNVAVRPAAVAYAPCRNVVVPEEFKQVVKKARKAGLKEIWLVSNEGDDADERNCDDGTFGLVRSKHLLEITFVVHGPTQWNVHPLKGAAFLATHVERQCPLSKRKIKHGPRSCSLKLNDERQNNKMLQPQFLVFHDEGPGLVPHLTEISKARKLAPSQILLYGDDKDARAWGFRVHATQQEGGCSRRI